MWYRRHNLTAAHQYGHLRGNPLCRGQGRLKRGRVTWRYDTSPTPLSRRYRVRIEYRQDAKPHVFVEDPDLVALAEGRALPHVYSERPVRLCLYLPDAGEWRADMRIDLTIVPWTALWLFYFEEWLSSDEWKGGGVHPGHDDD